MKNKVIVTVAVLIVLVVAWRAFTPQSPESVGYDELDSEIQGFLEDLDSLDVEPDDELTIEPFELDPENEDMGGVY